MHVLQLRFTECVYCVFKMITENAIYCLSLALISLYEFD